MHHVKQIQSKNGSLLWSHKPQFMFIILDIQYIKEIQCKKDIYIFKMPINITKPHLLGAFVCFMGPIKLKL